MSGISVVVGTPPTARVSGRQDFDTETFRLSADSATSNVLTDLSQNNLDVFPNGNVVASSFSPFDNGNYGILFNGTSDSLAIPTSSAVAFGTGDFTIEMWFYSNAAPALNAVLYEGRGTSSSTIAPYIASNGQVFIGSSSIFGVVSSIVAGRWYHMALTRSGTTLRQFVNGVQVASTTNSSNMVAPTTELRIGRNDAGTGWYNGYMSNIRVVKGTALYTAAFSPDNEPLTAITNTTLLINSSSFRDESTSNLTVSTAGTPRVVGFNPFVNTSRTSVSFNNASNDHLTASTGFVLSTGPFTIEGWFNPTATNRVQFLVANRYWQIGNNGGWMVQLRNTGAVSLFVHDGTFNTAPEILTSSGTLQANSWNHVAFTRDSSNLIRCFINGVLSGSVTSAVSLSAGTTAPFTIAGAEFADGAYQSANGFTGNISNVRVVDQACLYTAAFTPSTSPLNVVPGTKVLLCADDRFIDTSSNHYAVTTSTTLATSLVVPFSYQPKIYQNGSAYFQGLSTVSARSATQPVAIGTGDFTIEGWFYISADTSGYTYLATVWWNNGSGTVDAGFRFGDGGFGNKLQFSLSEAGSFPDRIYSTALLRTNLIGRWVHMALTRASGVLRFFVNGALQNFGTGINPGTYPLTQVTNTANIGAGYYLVGQLLNGYASNVRVTNTALYTASFTPSTVPLSKDTSTMFLSMQSPGNATSEQLVDESRQKGLSAVFGNPGTSTFTPYSSAYSTSFNTSYLAAASNAALGLGTGDFTIELWAYSTVDIGTSSCLIDFRASGVATAVRPTLFWGNRIPRYFVDGVDRITAGTTLALNKWYHIAVCRAAGQTRLFIDGVQSGSTFTDSFNYLSPSEAIIGQTGDNRALAGGYFRGFISNVRVLKGTALYTTAFTPPTAPLTAITNTSLLINGPNFIDRSVNAIAVTPTPTATAGSPLVVGFAPFSVPTTGNSGYFVSSTDYVRVDSLPTIGTADYTFEFWIYPIAPPATNQFIFSIYNGSNDTGRFLIVTSNSSLQLFTGGTQRGSNATMVSNVWNHVAVSRTSGSVSFYVNGTRSGTAVADTTSIGAHPIRVGGSGTGQFTGYMAGVHLESGIGRYSGATITVPTTPPQESQYTHLLMNFSGSGFSDDAGHNAIRTFGSAHTSPSTRLFGSGAMNFNGTTDYVQIPNSPLLNQTGAWTVEMWFRPNAVGANRYLYTQSTSQFLQLALDSSNRITIDRSGVGVLAASANNAIAANTWYHVAMVCTGATAALFLNGVRQGPEVAFTSGVASAKAVTIGAYDTPSLYFSGQIEDLVVTQYAKYVDTFTPPAIASVSPLPNKYVFAADLAWAVPRQLPLDVTARSYTDAVSYVARSRLLGYSDWRLPTKEEVEKLCSTYTPEQLRALGWPSASNSWAFTTSDYDGSNKWVHGMDSNAQSIGSPAGFSFAPPATTYPTIYAVSAAAGGNGQPLVATTTNGAKFTGVESTGTVTTTTPISVGHIVATENVAFDTTLGKALRFNATSGGYVDIQQSTYSATVVPFTAQFWIYPTESATKRAALIHAVAPGTAGSAGYAAIRVDIQNFSPSFRFRLHTSTNGTSWAGFTDEATNRAINNWYHVAVVFDTTSRIYVNGTQVLTSGALTPSFRTGRHTLGAGLLNSTTFESDRFRGYIQDFQVLDGVALYTSNFTPPPRGSL